VEIVTTEQHMDLP